MNLNEKDIQIANLNGRIQSLMADLSANTSSIGDWKVIKIYEARLKGEEDPYDYDELAAKRQAVRDEINQLQEELAEVEREIMFGERRDFHEVK